MLFWPSPRTTNFRGRQDEWPDFLNDFLRQHQITDIVMFGDCRYYHRIAGQLAHRHGIAVHVFEEGYLRPDWITLEHGATNANSLLPKDPELIRSLAKLVPAPSRPTKVGGSFTNRAVWDVAWQATNMLLRPLFPHYVRHRPVHPLREGLGWLRRLARRGRDEQHAAQQVAALMAKRTRFFVLPLQLDSDFQIRVHSEFENMQEVLETVFASFAAHAPQGVRLLVKAHPLDNGLVDRFAQTQAIASRYGIAERVDVIDGGHMPTLLRRAEGVVVVNSTAGLAALQYRRPTIALGRAMFDIDGLTFQNGLDAFWSAAAPPDRELFRAFRRLLLAQTQVNGSFFNMPGIRLGVEGASLRLGLIKEPDRDAPFIPEGRAAAALWPRDAG